MKILEQLAKVFRQTDEDIANSLKDPVRDAAFAIQDSETEINKLTSQLHDLMTNTENLQKQLADAQADVNKYSGYAQRAAQRMASLPPDSSEAVQCQADIREAVEAKQRAAALVNTLTTNIAENSKVEQRLQDQIASARSMVANAETNKARLTATLASNQLREKYAAASAQFGSKQGKGLSALNDLQKAVDATDSSAKAWEKLSSQTPVGREKSLEDKYGSTATAVDDEVAQRINSARTKALPASSGGS